MIILNEEPAKGKKPDNYVMIINTKEAKLLVEMINAAAEANSKKKTWVKFVEEVNDRLTCF